MNLQGRMRALTSMAGQMQESTFSDALVEAYMKDTGFLKKDIYEREIKGPIAILKEVGEVTGYTKSFGIDFEDLRPLGKVAVLLPKNGINLLVSKAICSSFLAGNETLVKLPAKLRHSATWYKKLMEDHLPGVSIVSNELSSEMFVRECIASPEIKAIVIYGDDKWIWSYKNAVRNSDTKLIFEGPGKDPQVIMPDADLELAVSDAIAGGLLNGGQSCSAIERFFVHKDIEDIFLEKLVDQLAVLKVGPPENEDSGLGPINSINVLSRLMEQVEDACLKGGDLIVGGKPVEINGSGKYGFLPAVIRNCKRNMKIFQEENFGPAFPVMSFSSEEDLLSKLDDTNYGLNASIYGSCSPRLGNYLINNHRNTYFNSTVTSPCNIHSRILDGGYKNSGLIWEWDGSSFLQREGTRMLLRELSAKA